MELAARVKLREASSDTHTILLSSFRHGRQDADHLRRRQTWSFDVVRFAFSLGSIDIRGAAPLIDDDRLLSVSVVGGRRWSGRFSTDGSSDQETCHHGRGDGQIDHLAVIAATPSFGVRLAVHSANAKVVQAGPPPLFSNSSLPV